MTGAQAASLKRLADEIREPHAFDAGLSKSEATRRIDRLQERVRLRELPPQREGRIPWRDFRTTTLGSSILDRGGSPGTAAWIVTGKRERARRSA